MTASDPEPEPRPDWETLKTKPAPGPPSPQALGEQFPHLEILELLGQGGMGYVYKARQRGLDRLVALKLLPAEISGEKDFAQRFAREARALARLSHPCIVMVHDSGRTGGLYYFVMEFVEGLNLRELLSRSAGRLDPDQAARIVGSICDALEYAHEEGVIHRDIKPENILLDARGRVKIADFGLAKLVGADADAGGTALTVRSPHQLMGTPHYMAPEQVQRPLDVDHRADIYSVGVVFYEMLTGDLPIGRFPLPSETATVDRSLDDVVLRALERDPDKRYQRASEIRTAVDSALLAGAPPGPEAGSGVAPGATASPVPAPIPPRPTPPAGLAAPGDASTVAATPSELGFPLERDIADAFRRVRGPANLLILGAICALLSTNILGIITIVGAIKMKRLETRPLAIAGAIASLVPLSICFPLGIIAGAWALWLLTRPEIAASFDAIRSARSPKR